jgi:amino acid adenylation domain-containing protein
MDDRSWNPVPALTPLQQGMLFHSLREAGSSVYCQQLTVRLAGWVDPGALRQAWCAVLARHDALRLDARWQPDREVPCFVTGESDLPFALVDHSARDAADHDAVRREFLQADRARGFAPDGTLLMRVTLLQWSARCWDLVWTHHHALVDGWSTGLVLADVIQAYEAALQGRKPQLPPARSFGEFLRWLARRDPLADQAFWQEALAGFTQATPLPLLKQRAGADAPSTTGLQRELTAGQVQALASVARSAGVSPATAVIACWGLLLGRHAGRDESVFGLASAGRPPQLADAERMVGLFINTIPLRLPAPAAGRIAAWLAQVQQRLAAAREHEHTALTRIAQWCAPAPGQPLFESLVAVENYPLAVAGDRVGEARIEQVRLDETPSVPLALLAEPGGDALVLRLLADSTRIAPADAQRMLDQVHFLLEQLAGGVDMLERLELLRPQERATILHTWNATEAPYDRDATLAGLFAAQARRTPEATALIDAAGDSLTYAQVHGRVVQLAHRLAQLELPPCSPVAVRLGRGHDLVVALLAVVSAGHHYVPIEPQLPAARVDAILAALPVRVILTDAAHATGTAELAGARASTMRVDESPSVEVTGFEPRARSGDPAYVIFTSGSTGRPKGVLVKHTPAVNLIEWVNRRFAVGPRDRLLFVTSPAFDLSVYDVFGLLAAGGSIRIASEAELADPQQLADLLVHGGITFWDSAPAALWQLAPLWPDSAVPFPPAALRLVFLSGDWVPLPLPDRLRQVFPGACVVALGGATEATIWSNYHVVERVDAHWTSIPYGRPIQNARYYVLDERLQPCPVGIAGDLFIGGECLAEGYVGQPELTAQRFIADPFAARPEARMYRTGDRARFGADGVMEFLGRVDTQVKLRGFRIELGEIELALGRHPAVRDAVCALHDRGAGGPASGAADLDLIAWYVPQAGQAITGDDLRRHLAQLLPAPMVPAVFVELRALPLSANGKIDRRQLPVPASASAPGSAGGGSGDPLRDTIAAVWCDVLGLDAIADDTDFFAAGGHSLRATSAVARLRAALGIDIPLRSIFEHPTLRGFAQAVRSLADGAVGPAPSEDIPRLDPAAGLPLSRAQSRLWFLHQLEPDSPAYNVALAAKIGGVLDLAVLQGALADVIARHPVLDTVIDASGPQPLLRRAQASLALPFRCVDITAATPEQRAAEALGHLTLAARVPFRLHEQRPVRIAVARTGTDEAWVLILMDHIATDGWSIAILAQDLLAAYDARTRGASLPAPAGPNAAEFAAWWDRHVQDHWLPAELGYWQQALAGLHPLPLPTDRPRGALPPAGARLHFELDAHLSAQLRRTAQRHAATLFMLLLTAFEVVLRRRCGREEITVGTDVAGRDHPLAERLVGFFVNQLVLRTDFAGCASFADMLAAVRRCTLEGFFHQHVPFELLVQQLNPPREPGAMPLFQHKFVLQNAPLAQLGGHALRVEPVEIETATAKYDLLLTVVDEPALRGTLEFSTALFDAATAQALVHEFQAVLAQVAADAAVGYDGLQRMLDVAGEARADAARRELRRSGLQRLRELTRPAAGTS